MPPIVLDLTLLIMTLAAVISKFLDLWSTIRNVSASVERNPLVHFLMKKLNMSFVKAIWSIALFAVLIAIGMGVGAYVSGRSEAKLSVSLYLLIASYFQYGAYFLNEKKKLIFGMHWLLRSRYYK